MSDVLTFVESGVGRIRLNRRRALHALTQAMCEGVLDALEAWRGDPKLSRGFCAGGDIRMLADSGVGDGTAARAFFRAEYRMNHRLFTYAKPIVAVMDGVTMGGGVGISQPARYRIATENTRFAMPETGIGLFPDVGGGWYLSRLPGRVGRYLALTGHRLDGAECLALGLATHYLPAARGDAAKAAVAARPQEIAAVLDDMAQSPPDAAILARREAIDRLFASDHLEEVFAALEVDPDAFAAETLATLRTRSPLSLKVSLLLLKHGAAMAGFADEMAQEYAVATRIVQRPDFAEGVRAVLIDKDNAPRWDPATPEAATDHMIDRIFAPLPADEAWTPG